MSVTRSADARLVTLTSYESWQRLEEAEDTIGRVVWVTDGQPSIVPVNVVVADGAVWFQTSETSALCQQCSGRPVLVEVDHADAATHSGWSVVVAGTAERVDRDDAVQLLARLRVWPHVPHSVFLSVQPDRVTGRRLVPSRG